MRLLICSFFLIGLAACNGNPIAGPTGASSNALSVGSGYRGEDDPCKRVGRSPVTETFLSSDADLVGCPIDFEGRSDFIRSLHATEATRTDEWVVYSVPLIGDASMSGIPTTPPITGG